MGDQTRQYTSAERQQVRRNERVQRRDHVRHRSGHKLRAGGQTGRHVHNVGGVHNILQHRHTVPGLRAEGT